MKNDQIRKREGVKSRTSRAQGRKTIGREGDHFRNAILNPRSQSGEYNTSLVNGVKLEILGIHRNIGNHANVSEDTECNVEEEAWRTIRRARETVTGREAEHEEWK